MKNPPMGYQNPERKPTAWAVILILGMATILLLVALAAVWATSAINWPALLDFIAPTAADARDNGWEAIVESM